MTNPKRPSSPPPTSARPGPPPVGTRPSRPSGTREALGGSPSRPSGLREAIAEAHALGGGAVARPSAATGANPSRKTILLVDQDPELRRRMRAELEPHYEVVEAKDGLEAVELTSKIHPPAMIVADTAMPRLDGFGMAKILRSNPLTRRVPIMFVSAQNDAQSVTQALVIGVRQYVPKSTPLTQIVEKIRKIVA